jgi:hypothetical protein
MSKDRVDVFVSYASEDRAFAAKIAKELQRRGLSVWSDRNILAGRDFTREISHALEQASVVIVLLSGTAGRSTWLKEEVSAALSQRKNVIPVLLGPDSKSNFVWPLVSDRQAIYVESLDDTSGVVDNLTRIIQEGKEGGSASGRAGTTEFRQRSVGSRASRTVWLMVIIAALAAFLGAMFALAVFR